MITTEEAAVTVTVMAGGLCVTITVWSACQLGWDIWCACLLTCGGGQVVCVDVVVVGVMVKQEHALETRAAGYCETKVGRGPSRLCWGVPA